MTFSFKPRSSSRLPMIAASVSTRVVSWKEAAASQLSVESEARGDGEDGEHQVAHPVDEEHPPFFAPARDGDEQHSDHKEIGDLHPEGRDRAERNT